MYIIVISFKVLLWGGVQFPTGSKVCEEGFSLPNGCDSRTDGIVRMVKEGKTNSVVLSRSEFFGALFNAFVAGKDFKNKYF